MKYLSYLLASALALALVLTSWAFVMARTLGSATYLDQHAEQAQLYQRLAAAIPEANIDPAAFRSQVQSFLPGLIDHLTKGGPAPTVDLNGAPFTLTLGPADDKVAGALGALQPVGIVAPLSVLVLIVLIFVLLRDRRLPTLARGLLQGAVSLAISAGILWVAPTLILSALNSPGSAQLKPVIEAFLQSVFHDMALQFGIAAVALLLVSIGVRVVHHTARLKARFIKPKEPSKRQTPTPPGAFVQ